MQNRDDVEPKAGEDDRDAYLSSYFGTERHAERDEVRRIGGFVHNFADMLPERGAVCLEIGPGKGEILHWLVQRGYQVRGVDVSSEVVDFCNRSLPGCVEHASDTEEWLNSHPAEYDVVLMLHVLEHIPKRHVVSMLCAIRKALRPGGRLLIEVPNMGNPLVGLNMRYADWTHEVGFTVESLRYVVLAAGFPGVVVRPIELPPDRWYRFLQKAAQRMLALALRIVGLAVGVRSPSVIAHYICAVVRVP